MENFDKFRSIGATTYLSPVPVVMLGCADPSNNIRPNLITVAWAGIVCSKPPMVSVSIRKERYCHGIIKNTGEFTINLTSQELCRATDFCGVKSGRDLDKFAEMNLTAIPAPGLSVAPAVAEAPAFLSCKVKEIIELGSHDLFLAEVVDVNIAQQYFTESGAINEEAMDLVGFVHGKYRAMSDVLGFFGYSIASDEALERRGMKR